MKRNLRIFLVLGLGIASCGCFLFALPCCAEDKKIEPLIVNGDTVEYLSDTKEFVATGNVEVIYKGATLTCDKLSVNAQNKSGVAEGHARLEDGNGVIEGDRISYNFDNKTGSIAEAGFRVNPYFGRAQKMQRLGDGEFRASYASMTTCSLDNPHYRFKTRKMDMFPQDKVITKDTLVYVGGAPLLYLPQYRHSLQEPFMHVQVMPGKRKDWGPYVLSAWRYSLAQNLAGHIFFDVRQRLGVAQGFDTIYKSENFGTGNFKFYYTHEKDGKIPDGQPDEFERYLVRWRHRWDIDERTNLISEYYKIVDSKREVPVRNPAINFLKDYFPREYEKDSQPLSYTQVHRAFDYSSLDILVQPRTNRWYTETEKLPQITYTMPSLRLGASPVYLEHSSSFDNLNSKNAVPSPSTADVSLLRFDFLNKFSLPAKVAFLNFTPFVGSHQTVYDKDISGRTMWGSPRTIFLTGADVSTKFYRLYDMKSKFLGMEVDGLRHIITPSVGYAYQHAPTVPASRIKFSDGLAISNAATIELSNKLQTKRKGVKVNILDLRFTSAYNFKTGDDFKKRGSLADFLTELDLIPYSWVRLHGDAIYKHSGDKNRDVNPDYNRISEANYDLSFYLGEERFIGFGQRFQRQGGDEFTCSFTWRLNPKWKFSLLQRYQLVRYADITPGLWEQEYTVYRDLHCWVAECTLNSSKTNGTGMWFVFRLKAFPELQFNFNQSYSAPKPGPQENP